MPTAILRKLFKRPSSPPKQHHVSHSLYTKTELMHLSILFDDLIREDILERTGKGEFVEVEFGDIHMPSESNGYQAFYMHVFNNGRQMFLINLEELPLHINDDSTAVRAVARWRLDLGR